MAIAILSANSSNTTGKTLEAPRIDAIHLFGSRQLVRQGKDWTLIGNADQPQQLTERESMFVNAAIRAARGQS